MVNSLIQAFLPSEPNPVLRREIRARWRSNRSFYIVFGYAIALAVLAYFNYRDAAEGRDLMDALMLDTRKALPGRALFIQFNQWQMAGWLILAPLLTAGAIAGERERGLLENLLLAPLTKQQIIHGKWLSALALAALLLLVPLPVAAICFQLGGLSPQEFIGASLLQALTAVLGATVGLWSSTRVSRLNEAIAQSLVNTWFWGWAGPLIILPLFFSSYVGGALLLIGVISFEIVVIAGLLANAVWQLGQPMKEMRPEIKRTWMDAPDAARPMTLDIGRGEPISVTSNDLYTKDLALNDPERYKRWDMPGAELLRFENPVLQRELRVHLRLKAQHVGAQPGGGAGCSLAFVALAFGGYFLAVLADSGARSFFWGIFASLWIIAAALTGAALGSSAFTRERAAGMLQFLMLTCLTPREILWGKVAGTVIVIAYYSLSLLPALLPCTIPRFDGGAGLTGTHMMGTGLLVFSTAWFATSWGALVSWLSRQNFVATAVALLGIICFPYVPALNHLNPLEAQAHLQPGGYISSYRDLPPASPRDVFFVPGGLFLLGLLCFLITLYFMRRDLSHVER